MAEPFVGQIEAFGFPFAPRSWAYCDGSTVPLRQYTALFALIGTAFGGDGVSTIGLPKLNGASPCGTGQGAGLTNRYLGQQFGTATVTLDQTTLPAHTHGPNALSLGRTGTPMSSPSATGGLAATASNVTCYANGGANAVMSPQAISPNGNGAAHNNLQPFIAMNYSIALLGTYPYFN